MPVNHIFKCETLRIVYDVKSEGSLICSSEDVVFFAMFQKSENAVLNGNLLWLSDFSTS